MKKIAILCFGIIILSAACIHKTGTIEDLKSGLKNSITFHNYCDYISQEVRGIKTGQFNTKDLNNAYLLSQNAYDIHNLPKPRLYEIYSKAGLKDSKNYIDCRLNIDSTYGALIKEFPALDTMTKVRRLILFKSIRDSLPHI